MACLTFWAAISACVYSGAWASSVKATGQTVSVNGIDYFAPPKPISTLPGISKVLLNPGHGEDLLPLTVMVNKEQDFSIKTLKALVKNFTAADDVFNPGFLQSVYVTYEGSGNPGMQAPTSNVLSKHGITVLAVSKQYQRSPSYSNISTIESTKPLKSGPYFLSPATGEVFEAYRLYSDVQGAFTEGIIAADDDTYSVLDASVPGSQSLTIGVPSRLYFEKTAQKPLAGVRFGIKDIYDIAGVRTSCCNRAYYNLYPERNVTAPSIQRLIDAGAVIVGKMKTSQFADGETATADWVDYHAPFNARGDGYQDPSSSSAGPGAGCGAYAWLDVTVGSDTGGSIRNPAQVNGCFGNRPTHGLVALDGVMPMSPALDTPGFLARDPGLWHDAAKVMYEGNITSEFKAFPTKLYTAGFPENPSTEAEKILTEFARKVRTFLKANATKYDIASRWAANPPAQAKNASIADYLGATYAVLIAQQQHKLLTVPFFKDYAAAHDGRQPAVDPAAKIRWDWGQKNISSHALDEHLYRKAVFVDWWKKNGNKPDNRTCSDSILLYPGSLAQTNYRNQYRGPPGVPIGWDVSRISNLGSVPDVVVPIGQAAYNSTVTNHEEYLPVAIDFVAAAGCDGMLFELVNQLAAAGIVTPPKAGSVLY